MGPELYFPTLLDFDRSADQRFVHFSQAAAETSLRLVQFGSERTVSNYGYGPGVREHHLLHYVLKGCGDVTVAGKRFRVHENEVFFIPQNCVSYYESDNEDPWLYAWIGFKGVAGDAALELAHLSADRPVASIPDPDAIRDIISDMEEAMFEPHGYFLLMSGLYRLLSELTKTEGREAAQAEATVELDKQNADKQINYVKYRIEQGFDKPITVQQLADEAGLTRPYLSAVFKKRTGYTIKEYITVLRMDKAKMLLLQTNASTKAIALLCGYDDPLYFSRIFRKYVGCTPSEHRSGYSKQG